MDIGGIITRIKLDTTDFKKGIDESRSKLDTFKGTIGNVGQGLTNIKDAVMPAVRQAALLTAGGIAALGFEAKTAVSAYEASAKGLAQLDAVLKSTGGAAGVTKYQVQTLAAEMQDMTAFEDDAIISAENLLLTFTSIGKDVFPTAIRSIADMSTAMGQDLQSSVIQVGKALNDPVQGISALARVGVQFNATQEETIKKLVEGGKTMDAQKLILAELNKEFGGSAAAALNTFSGRMEQAKNAIGNIQESIGGVIVEALWPFIDQIYNFIRAIGGEEGAAEKTADFIDVIARAGQWIGSVSRDAIPYLVKGFLDLRAALAGIMDGKSGDMIRTISEVLASTAVKSAITGLAMAFETLAKGLQQVDAVLESLAERGLVQTISDISGFSGLLSNTQRQFRDLGKSLKLPGFAAGISNFAGGLAVVGERGPETVALPRGSSVFSNTSPVTQGALHGDTTFNITAVINNDMDIDMLAKKLAFKYRTETG